MSDPAPSYRNDLEIQFFGLRRSGNHGVIAWIAQQYDAPIAFLNDVSPFDDPFTTFALGKIPNAVPERKLAPDATEQFRAAYKNLLLISYEDLKLQELDGADILPERRRWLGESRQMRGVLLLRDFYNWFASRIRLIEKRSDNNANLVKRSQRLIDAWLSYAREFTGETAYLGTDGLERVSYNRWLSDDRYGASLLERLGIPMSNISRTIVPQTGGGSSFGDNPMDVLDRWKYLLGPNYTGIRDVLTGHRADIDAYNRKIFDLQSPF
jgi:hypothetical protein